MSTQDVLPYVKARPFRPFRIQMASGRDFDVRHPEMVRVGRTILVVFSFLSDDPDVFDKWETASLVLVESISHLEGAVA
jgi:hypothetical protein